jgi:hypothetical protein
LSREQFELAVKFFTAGRKNEMVVLPFDKSTSSGSPDVLPSTDGPCCLGAGLAGLAGFSIQGLHTVRYSHRTTA